MNFFKTSLGIVSVGALSSAVAGTYFLSSGKKENLGFSNSLSTKGSIGIPVLESSPEIVENVPELVFENSESTLLVDIPLTEKVAEVDLLDTETDDMVEDDSDIAPIIPSVPVKSDFVGKLIFFEEYKNPELYKNLLKPGVPLFIYKFKFLNTTEYNSESSKYGEIIEDDGVAYDGYDIIIDISHRLNLEETKNKLGDIFASDNLKYSKLKEIVLEKAEELKELLGAENYENMKKPFVSSKESK